MIPVRNGVVATLSQYGCWVRADAYALAGTLYLRTNPQRSFDTREEGPHVIIYEIEHWFDEAEHYGTLIALPGNWEGDLDLDRDTQAKIKAPIIPPATCPEVDSLSTLLDAIGADLSTFLDDTALRRRKTYDREEVRELLHQTAEGMASARLRLEDLRNANDQLRSSGRHWRVQHGALAADWEKAAAALREWKCDSCGGSGIYRQAWSKAHPEGFECTCKRCGGTKLHPVAAAALGIPVPVAKPETIDPREQRATELQALVNANLARLSPASTDSEIEAVVRSFLPEGWQWLPVTTIGGPPQIMLTQFDSSEMVR